MKATEFSIMLGKISDKYIREANEYSEPARKRVPKAWIAFAACVAIIIAAFPIGIVIKNGGFGIISGPGPITTGVNQESDPFAESTSDETTTETTPPIEPIPTPLYISTSDIYLAKYSDSLGVNAKNLSTKFGKQDVSAFDIQSPVTYTFSNNTYKLRLIHAYIYEYSDDLVFEYKSDDNRSIFTFYASSYKPKYIFTPYTIKAETEDEYLAEIKNLLGDEVDLNEYDTYHIETYITVSKENSTATQMINGFYSPENKTAQTNENVTSRCFYFSNSKNGRYVNLSFDLYNNKLTINFERDGYSDTEFDINKITEAEKSAAGIAGFFLDYATITAVSISDSFRFQRNGYSYLYMDIQCEYLYATSNSTPCMSSASFTVVIDVTNYVEGSSGLKYEYINTLNIKILGIGTCKDTDIVVGNHINGDNTITIGEYAFSNCNSIKSITLSTGINRISPYAFANNTSLEKITLPKSISLIAEYAFSQCPSLKDIFFNGTKAEWNSINRGRKIFDGTNNVVVHCTDGELTIEELK